MGTPLGRTASKFARGGLLLLCIHSVSACAALDSFSPRADDFNQETADTKSASVLTNIMRAAYAEPLQFTDITTAQGSGNLQASTGSTLPFPFRGGFGVPLAQQFLTFTPGAQASASNQFVVQNLNTQEFYNGIQAPVSTQLISYFMSAGFDKRILLTLLISEIDITLNKRRAVFRNDLDNTLKDPEQARRDFWFFYQIVSYLIEAGFSGEQISDTTAVGPALSPEEARDPKLLSALVNPAGTDPLSLREVRKGAAFQLTKKSPGYRFCFDPTLARSGNRVRQFRQVGFVTVEAQPRPGVVTLGEASGAPIPELTLRLNSGDFCGADATARIQQSLDLTVRLRTRSVEGTFNYLGAMVRLQLGLSGAPPLPLSIPDVDGPRFDLFRLDTGFAADAGVSIKYRGKRYGLVVDPSGQRDGSGRVLQLLTTLIALQSSSKAQPAPNLITVLGP